MFYPPAGAPCSPRPGTTLYTGGRASPDVLLAYPYQSIRPFISMLLCRLRRDPTVISIKMTLYRMAQRCPRSCEALISAAENGKEVVAIVELRARFDEQNNIDWSKQLEDAGCTVYSTALTTTRSIPN